MNGIMPLLPLKCIKRSFYLIVKNISWLPINDKVMKNISGFTLFLNILFYLLLFLKSEL